MNQADKDAGMSTDHAVTARSMQLPENSVTIMLPVQAEIIPISTERVMAAAMSEWVPTAPASAVEAKMVLHAAINHFSAPRKVRLAAGLQVAPA